MPGARRATEVAGGLEAVRAGLARVLKTYGRDRLELEFRLGHRAGGRFVPGVAEPGWRRLKDALDAAVASDSSEVAAVIESDTRELLCDDVSGAKYVTETASDGGFWMHKKRLHDYDLDTGHPWGCRASLSLEVVDPPESQAPAPAPGAHRFERRKQRWSYRYRCWSFDLTRVVSNLPHQLDSEGVGFEVEIELRDTGELFARPAAEVLAWGWRLVGDACRLMSGDDTADGRQAGTGAPVTESAATGSSGFSAPAMLA